MSHDDDLFAEVPEADALEQRTPLEEPGAEEGIDLPEPDSEADPVDRWEQASDLPDDDDEDYDRGAADESA